MSFVDIIRRKFDEQEGTAKIPKLRDGSFIADRYAYGIVVDNLVDEPILPWKVFDVVEDLLDELGGSARRGDAMGFRLGDPELPFNSIEGRVACEVFGASLGQSVSRRITPIECILIWAGVCSFNHGKLVRVCTNSE